LESKWRQDLVNVGFSWSYSTVVSRYLADPRFALLSYWDAPDGPGVVIFNTGDDRGWIPVDFVNYPPEHPHFPGLEEVDPDGLP